MEGHRGEADVTIVFANTACKIFVGLSVGCQDRGLHSTVMQGSPTSTSLSLLPKSTTGPKTPCHSQVHLWLWRLHSVVLLSPLPVPQLRPPPSISLAAENVPLVAYSPTLSALSDILPLSLGRPSPSKILGSASMKTAPNWKAEHTEECSPSCMSIPSAFFDRFRSAGRFVPASSLSGPYDAVSRVMFFGCLRSRTLRSLCTAWPTRIRSLRMSATCFCTSSYVGAVQ